MTLSDITQMRKADKVKATAEQAAQRAEDYKAARKETDERIKFAVRAGFPNVTVGYGWPCIDNAKLAKRVMKNYKELEPVYDYKGWDHAAAAGEGSNCTRVTVTYSWPINE